MKAKLKQKRGEPIALEGGIVINTITKNEIGWIARATCNSTVTSDPTIQSTNPVMFSVSKQEFDRLQPGDQIRFLAVVTRPRKVKIKSTSLSGNVVERWDKDSKSAIAAEGAG